MNLLKTMFTNQELKRQYNRISDLIAIAKKFEPDDVLGSHLTKYICVLCSGFIENSIYHAFSDIAERSCQPSVVLTYTKSQLFKIQNANSEKIRELAKSFNPFWEERIKNFMQENNRGAAINYILKDRNNIAHGKDSDITIGKLEEYLLKTVEVIKYIEDNIDKPTLIID